MAAALLVEQLVEQTHVSASYLALLSLCDYISLVLIAICKPITNKLHSWSLEWIEVRLFKKKSDGIRMSD